MIIERFKFFISQTKMSKDNYTDSSFIDPNLIPNLTLYLVRPQVSDR